MDKWLTLSQAANKLNIHEHDLLDLAIEGAITFHWLPRGFIHVYSIDMSAGEARYFDDKKPYPYEQPIDTLREGYFEIDLTLCPSWESPLNDIKLGGKGYGSIFESIDPLVIREVGPDGYIWSVTPPPELDTGKELDFPTVETLGVFQKELSRYKNPLPKTDGINKQRKDAYKQYLDETNQWNRLKEERTGLSQLKDEVYNALKNLKAKDGSDLFSGKPMMKKSWEEFKSEKNR